MSTDPSGLQSLLLPALAIRASAEATQPPPLSRSRAPDPSASAAPGGLHPFQALRDPCLLSASPVLSAPTPLRTPVPSVRASGS